MIKERLTCISFCSISSRDFSFSPSPFSARASRFITSIWPDSISISCSWRLLASDWARCSCASRSEVACCRPAMRFFSSSAVETFVERTGNFKPHISQQISVSAKKFTQQKMKVHFKIKNLYYTFFSKKRKKMT